MEVILGKTSGFCYGVNNAVIETKKYIQNHKDKNVYCLGELLHNRQVIEELENEKLIFIKNKDELVNKIDTNSKNITVIIRAHGEPKSTYEILEDKKVNILDLTCPNVSAIHKIVENAIENDFYIFLIGKKNHPETIGTYGFCKGNCSVIENEDDINIAFKELFIKNMNKIFVVAQTTFSLEKFNEFTENIRKRVQEDKREADSFKIDKSNKMNEIILEIKNTICNATKLRQDETEKLSKQVDYMIIIGGKNSSNTRKLYEISDKNCKRAILIENCEELKNEFKEELKEIKSVDRVGVMAGASTPKQSIDEVLKLLN